MTTQADSAAAPAAPQPSASLFEALVASSDDAIFAEDQSGLVIAWNRGAEKLFGFSATEALGQPAALLVPDEQRGQAITAVRQVSKGADVRPFDTVRLRKDGRTVAVSISVSPVIEDGRVVAVASIGRDITERLRADEKARAASEYARNLIESSLDPLVTISPEGKITDVNEATIKVTGVARADLIDTDFFDYFVEPDKAREGYKQVFLQGTVTDYPLTIRHRNGKLTDVLYNASLYRDSSGQVLGVFAAARDVTAQSEASQYARSLIEASLDPLVTISAEGKITDVNEATMRATGITRDRLIGADFSDYFVEPEKARAGYQQVFAQGFVTNYPLTIRHRDGRLTDVLYNAAVYRDSRGNVQGVFAAARDVTVQNTASQYARSLIEASLDPLVTISPEGKITDVNEASATVTGVARERLIGTDFSDYFVEPERARAGYQQVFSQGSVTDYPLTIRHQDGRLTDVLYNASVYKDARGNVLGVFAAARDVTAQKQASQYARSLIEASLDPLVTISPEGKITDVNEASATVTGLPREKLTGTDFSDYFTEPERAREGYQQVFERGAVSDYPLTIRHRKGQLTEVLYNASVYKDARGEVLGVFAAARDVTAQKQASQYARSLIEASLDPLVTISPEGKITDVNEATIRATGVARERLIGTDFSDYFAEPERAREGYQQVFAEGSVTDYPLTIRHRDGALTDVLYNASVYRDAREQVQGVFAAARDVTAQKQASQYARSLIEASLDPLVTISPEGKITDVNEASALVTGVGRDKLIGTDFSDYFTEPQRAREGYQQVFSQGSVTDYPLTIRHRNGRQTPVLYNASVYKDARGEVLGVFAAARDVTGQKQAEEEVAEQRSKELDRLAELERFQKLTVGRELKMIELKKEVSALRSKLGGRDEP